MSVPYNEQTTQWLLEGARSDPTILAPFKDDGQGPNGKVSRRTAYDLAKTKGVRDVFRRVAAAHPDWWDWFGAGHVPSALTQEMEEERDEKKKVKRKGLKDRIREREAKEKERDQTQSQADEVMKPFIGATQASNNSNRLGGASGTQEGVAGLTPQIRAAVERERRARAAEARMRTAG